MSITVGTASVVTTATSPTRKVFAASAGSAKAVWVHSVTTVVFAKVVRNWMVAHTALNAEIAMPR